MDTQQDILNRLTELENRSIKLEMQLTAKENLKNALFEGYFQSDKAEVAADANTPYLKVIWKNKIIYIPYFI